MCFPTPSAPAAAAAAIPPAPPPPPPADLAPASVRIGDDEMSSARSKYNAKKKGTSSLRIARAVGGTAASGTNIPKK